MSRGTQSEPSRRSLREVQTELAAVEKRLRELRLELAHAERQESIWAEDEHL